VFGKAWVAEAAGLAARQREVDAAIKVGAGS
jgi:hypothetical protein